MREIKILFLILAVSVVAFLSYGQINKLDYVLEITEQIELYMQDYTIATGAGGIIGTMFYGFRVWNKQVISNKGTYHLGLHLKKIKKWRRLKYDTYISLGEVEKAEIVKEQYEEEFGEKFEGEEQ